MRETGRAGPRFSPKAGGSALACLLLLAVVGRLSPSAALQGHDAQEVRCSECHTCEQPTSIHPCLKPLCPRHAASRELTADLGPDMIILDELENLYVPVYFNHLAHAQMVRFSGGCETCHHYTPPDSDHPACKDCHPSEIAHEDIAQPGLKGAYHRNCMSCHAEWDSDTACEVCHARRIEGQPAVVHKESHYRPIELEELIIFRTGYEEGDEVPFHHRNHSVLYERDCTECHAEQSCSRCHVHGTELHPMGTLAEVDLHDTCYKCHESERCEDCHGRDSDDLFSHEDTGWPLKAFHADLTCRTCHGQTGAFKKLTPVCENCHPEGWKAETFDHRLTGVDLDEVHGELDCGDCHVNGVGKAAACDGCHDDGRSHAQTGFGER